MEDITLYSEYPPDLICLLFDSTDQCSFKFVADIFLVWKNFKNKFTTTFFFFFFLPRAFTNKSLFQHL